MAGDAVPPVVGGQLNLGWQSKSLGLEGIKEVSHTGLNLNHKGLQEELKRRAIMNGAELLRKLPKYVAVYHQRSC